MVTDNGGEEEEIRGTLGSIAVLGWSAGDSQYLGCSYTANK